jgi:hypothetical protein
MSPRESFASSVLDFATGCPTKLTQHSGLRLALLAAEEQAEPCCAIRTLRSIIAVTAAHLAGGDLSLPAQRVPAQAAFLWPRPKV